jgi:hypothetical protein
MIFSPDKEHQIEMNAQTLEIKESDGVKALSGLGVLDISTVGISPLELFQGKIAKINGKAIKPEEAEAYQKAWDKLDAEARQAVMKGDERPFNFIR